MERGYVSRSGNNLIPVVLKPCFSSVPRTTFTYLIDPGTLLLRVLLLLLSVLLHHLS
jgi:hypothetical protein